MHRCGRAVESDVTVVAGIPCATVAWTLLDLAALLQRDALVRACELAERLRLFDLREVLEVLDRAGRRPGAGRLRAVLGRPTAEEGWTRSELERRFLRLCRRSRLPTPSVNNWVELHDGGAEVDFLWREHRVVSEVDGFRFHSSRGAFERDRERDQALTLAGYHVLRFGWRQVVGQPRAVAATIRVAFGRASRLRP